MNAENPDSAASRDDRSQRFHRWRYRKDSLARWVIAVGGIAVIGAVGLIFFYLLWVVFPLFTPASSESRAITERAPWATSRPIWLSIEEQQEIGFRISGDGIARFFRISDATEIVSEPIGSPEPLSRATADVGSPDLVAVAAESGAVYVVRHRYGMDFSKGVAERTVVPSLDFPFGEAALFTVPGGITDLAMVDDDRELTIAALGGPRDLTLFRAQKLENVLTGEITLDVSQDRRELARAVSNLAISGDRRWIYAGDSEGWVHTIDLKDLEFRRSLRISEGAVTELAMLLGGISVLAGDSMGEIFQAFPVRGEDKEFELHLVRSFPPQETAIRAIYPESRRKGFAALDVDGELGIYHSTAGVRVLDLRLPGDLQALALAPRANAAIIEEPGGSLAFLGIDNRHPEISWSSLWQEVWYENYQEPDYVWQSSAANTDFEPKFSLTPLVSGTLKAALYAMLFAVPLALMAAAYTAFFLAPAVREVIKPTIETIAALPTVVLGFLAGLWFAPYVEKHLAGIFMIFLVVPGGVLLFAWWWQKYRGFLKSRVAAGWEPLLLVPVIVLLGLLSMWLAEPVQSWWFGGDLRSWLTQVAGIDYDQRNALVVGCAMGFAVIPTIFSIAEDAFYGVPRHLSMGSLALGATPWQTMLHVVVPTASPGIFSALMIGFGRAVGETMIVLMATGNTPIMDWNIFEGMRTLAANIAVEMPESAVNSTHYRVLFLAALVLFVFTFIVNTGAEVIRQRLREKYSSL